MEEEKEDEKGTVKEKQREEDREKEEEEGQARLVVKKSSEIIGLYCFSFAPSIKQYQNAPDPVFVLFY
jgi:hypothetical protein